MVAHAPVRSPLLMNPATDWPLYVALALLVGVGLPLWLYAWWLLRDTDDN